MATSTGSFYGDWWHSEKHGAVGLFPHINIFLHDFLCVTLAGRTLTVEPTSSFLSDAFLLCDQQASNATPGKGRRRRGVDHRSKAVRLTNMTEWVIVPFFFMNQIYTSSYDGHCTGELHG